MSRDDILFALRTFFQPGDAVELRVLGKGKRSINSGYFKDFEKLAEAADKFDKTKTHNIYVTINKVDAGAYARSPEKMASASEQPITTSDDTIAERRWLPIDLDPKRVSGVSSTDDEHNKALAKAEIITLEMMNRFGWPAPVFADSGNGAHLLWNIKLPNRTSSEFADGMILIESVIKAFAVMFNDEHVEIDTKMFNAARIIRLHGTTTRKGSDIPERPWRQSKILRVPEKITTVTVDQLKYLAELYASTLSGSREPIVQQTYGDLDVGKWLQDHSIEVYQSKPNRDGGMTYVLEQCPWNEEHTDHSAYVMQFKSGAVVAKCHHNSCREKGWGDLRRLFEPEITIHKAEKPKVAEKPAVVKFTSVPRDCFELNSVGDLERLHALHPTDLKYCIETKTWMHWNGVKWNGRIKDSTQVYEAMHDVLDMLSSQASDPEMDKDARDRLQAYALKKGSAKMFRDTIDLAESDPRFAVSIMDFDQDPYLLNTDNCVIDLKNFQACDHDSTRLISKSVGYAYDEDAICPIFIKFLNEIFAGNEEIIAYLQRLIGYCLTGSMREKSFYIFWGPIGDNGKSVLTAVIRLLLGEYAATSSINTFLYSRNEHSARDDLAALRGARVVTMSEPEETARFAIGLIKNWTGRNPVTCRHLYGSLFTYIPTGKLLVETNLKPRIYERTEAAWDRVHLVPFEVTIPKEKQNKDLEQDLAEELPGILNWALDGLREYYRLDGLHPTINMRAETKQYRTENDSVKMFYDDCCTPLEHGKLSNNEVYNTYKLYCDGNGIKPLGVRKFIEALEPVCKMTGGLIRRTNKGLVWFGLGVAENQAPAEAC